MTAQTRCTCTTYGNCAVCRPSVDPATFIRPHLEDLVLLSDLYGQSAKSWRKRRALRRFARKLHVHESDLLLALSDFLFEIESAVVV